MNILTIDTATEVELVAVTSNTGSADKTRTVPVSHSTTLFSSIDSALRDVNLSITEIELIGVGIGPGSFTGIRIAVSTARMLAQLLKTPLVGIKTPLLYAASVNALTGEYILIAFDAKKGRVFGALYRKGDSLVPDEIISPGDYAVDYLIEGIEGGNTHLIGNGVKKYHDEFAQRLPNNTIYPDFIPSGERAGVLTSEIYKQSPDRCTVTQVRPFYARKSDAEIMKYREGKR